MKNKSNQEYELLTVILVVICAGTVKYKLRRYKDETAKLVGCRY